MTATLDTPAAGTGLESRSGMLRGAARGGLANLAGTVCTGAAGLGVTWLAARALDPRGAGAFFAATAVFGLGVTVAKLGVQTSLVYWPARMRATGDLSRLGECLRAALAPVAVAALVIAGGLWFAADLLPGRPDLVRTLAVFLPAAAVSDALLAATRGLRAMRPTVLLDRVMRPAAQLVLLALVWVAGWGPDVFAALWALPYLPAALFAGVALTRLRTSLTAGADGEPSDFTPRRFWAFTAPRAVASLAQMALQRVDVLLVAALAGLAPAAMYAVAGRFVILGQFVNQGVTQSVQPRLAERLAVRDTAGANLLYRQATAWVVTACWPLYLLMFTYAPQYLDLFGEHYEGGVPIVRLLSATMMVATACGMVDVVLAMAGRTWWNLANVGLALLTMLVLDAVLIPRHGAAGAAVGLCAAVLVNNLVPLVQVVRGLGLHPFGRATLLAGGLAASCFAVPQLAVLPVDGLFVQFAATGAGAVAYCCAVVRLRQVLLQGER
ncbi:lipopolysaccharide biosynthesis protein [Dactylosporangium aurantiacum]|uniref:Lipopolysaccharide biosynthesis protein n=1 Tax=Dactylosporangium aurantiacum TaxID=35754 RepID=A0A9Q9IES5_9ACTN|nr:lipopolysaccharide biosynthesis protein [Dactylosporangium aurantiacum]MDG6105406.1 lipopolysaccharide biosynthesis protein [Dactylosporangium aurantiacum]UWZ54051.1 lipopolysaccharide biosynthesis protein [Dactylosporangium aurantiacum]